jgi:ATP-dependent DNA ligase
MLTPPVPPMLAAPVPELPIGAVGYEPKWDGWRALLFRTGDDVYLQSRTGKPLGAYFPELVRVASASLPAGLVLDGELVIWDAEAGRTSFARLRRRVAAADRQPAHFVAFDLLQLAGDELLEHPLTARRDLLAGVLDGAPAELPLCPHTTDPDEARQWLANWPALGMEGLVIKPLGGRYRPGRRGWQKLREQHTADAVVAGVTGPVDRPETLLFGRFDADRELRYLGRSRPLTPAQRAAVGPALTPAGQRRRGGVNHPWPRPLPAGWSGPFGAAALDYRQVAPVLVAEVRVDAAYEHTRWRHPVRFVRIRDDLHPLQLPPLPPW